MASYPEVFGCLPIVQIARETEVAKRGKMEASHESSRNVLWSNVLKACNADDERICQEETDKVGLLKCTAWKQMSSPKRPHTSERWWHFFYGHFKEKLGGSGMEPV